MLSDDFHKCSDILHWFPQNWFKWLVTIFSLVYQKYLDFFLSNLPDIQVMAITTLKWSPDCYIHRLGHHRHISVIWKQRIMAFDIFFFCHSTVMGIVRAQLKIMELVKLCTLNLSYRLLLIPCWKFTIITWIVGLTRPEYWRAPTSFKEVLRISANLVK